jgi:NAD(P)-dependent dehydrogenase (short-subunit alcohol dehydrogenase family)
VLDRDVNEVGVVKRRAQARCGVAKLVVVGLNAHASRGAQVVLTSRKSGAGKAAVKRLAAQSLAVQFRPLDVRWGKSIAALREFLKRTYGRLDVLINNAGIIAPGDAAGLEVDMETVRATLETNALGPFHLSQALAPLLQRSKRARIVNISSGMGAFSDMEGDYAAYRISKTALNAVTAILAAGLRGRTAVNAVCPGWVRTDMGGRSAERDVTEGADMPVGMRTPQVWRPVATCRISLSSADSWGLLGGRHA